MDSIMNIIKKYVLMNRFTVLTTAIAVYLLVLVIEGEITGREALLIDLENSYFDLTIKDLDQFGDFTQFTEIDFE